MTALRKIIRTEPAEARATLQFEQAPCRLDPDTWFPDATNGGAQAKKYCQQCPYAGLWGPCADLGATEKYGIWGGLHPDTIRRQRRQARQGEAA